jgi:hypothetical protein
MLERDPILESFGLSLRRWRESKDLTQVRLAEKANLVESHPDLIPVANALLQDLPLSRPSDWPQSLAPLVWTSLSAAPPARASAAHDRWTVPITARASRRMHDVTPGAVGPSP